MPKFTLCVRMYVCKYVYLCICMYVYMYDVRHDIQIPCTRYVAINRLYLYLYLKVVTFSICTAKLKAPPNGLLRQIGECRENDQCRPGGQPSDSIAIIVCSNESTFVAYCMHHTGFQWQMSNVSPQTVIAAIFS